MEKSQLSTEGVALSIRNFLNHTPITKDMVFVVIGTYLSAAAAFICNLLVGRYLGPSGFGQFGYFLVLSPIFFELTGYGFDSVMVRFAAPEVSQNRDKTAAIFKLVFLWKILLNVFFITVGYIFSGKITLWLTGSTENINVIRLAFFMGFGFSLWRYAISVFQSLQNYNRYFVTLLANNVTKLIVIITVFFLFSPDINHIMLIYIGSAFTGFFVGIMMIPTLYSFKSIKLKNTLPLLKSINRLSIWVVLSTLIFLLTESLNVFMIGHFLNTYAVGIYTVAMILTKLLDHVTVSIKTVLLPKASSLEPSAYIKYVKKCLMITIPIAIAILPIFFISHILIEALFSKKFVDAIPVFNILFWGYWISLILDPIWLIFYSAQKTHYFIYSDIVMFLIVFVLNIFLIPQIGIIGAAYNLVIARFFGRFLLGIFLYFLPRPKSFIPAT